MPTTEKQRATNRRYLARRREKMRGILRWAKDRPCVDCGQRYPYYVMDLDHRDPAQKIDRVSRLPFLNVNLDRLLDEILKCDVVCANCHRGRTHRDKL